MRNILAASLLAATFSASAGAQAATPVQPIEVADATSIAPDSLSQWRGNDNRGGDRGWNDRGRGGDNRGGWNGRGDRDDRWNGARRDNDWRGNDRRGGDWRGDRRDNDWRDRNSWNGNDRYRQGGSYYGGGYYGVPQYRDRNDDRRWDNGWRRDNRYDWSDYRRQNRDLYRPGLYSNPYGNRSYSRFRIGVRVGQPYYNSRYWISDPWRYRLPPVHGGYRWVRYYDDVLLIDTRTGYVQDVIYSFFW